MGVQWLQKSGWTESRKTKKITGQKEAHTAIMRSCSSHSQRKVRGRSESARVAIRDENPLWSPKSNQQLGQLRSQDADGTYMEWRKSYQDETWLQPNSNLKGEGKDIQKLSLGEE